MPPHLWEFGTQRSTGEGVSCQGLGVKKKDGREAASRNRERKKRKKKKKSGKGESEKKRESEKNDRS